MSSGIEKKKKRRRVVKKHRNHHGGGAVPPSRLGWLGEGLSINDEQQLDNNFNGSQSSGVGLDNNNNKHDNNFMNGSQSSSNERLLTPRPDDDNDTKMSAAGMSKSNGGAVDLTADDSDDCNNTTKNSSSWTCRKCTLVNSQIVSVCDACNTRRESTRSSKSCTNKEIDSDDELLGGYDGDEPHAGKKKKHKRLKKGTDSSNTAAARKADDTVATKKDQKKKKKSNSSSSNGKKYQSTLLSEHLFTQPNNNNNNSKMKKSKPSTYKQHSFKNNSSSKSTTTKSKTTNTEMWIDKHAPQTIKEVCVAPKKIDEVRQFLNSHVEYTTYQRRRTSSNKRLQQQDNAIVNPWDIPTNPIQPQTKLQILVGSPGIGKSTLLSVLAQELNIEVLRWNDIHVDYNMNSGGGMGRDSGGGYLPYQSQLSSFEEFLNSGSVGITSLDIGGNNTSLKSSAEKKKRKGSSSSGKNSEEYVSSLILVEEIPNLYNDEAAQSFRNIMERHIQRTQTPTFFIFSDVQEGKHKPEDLERLIPPHILYSQLVQIIQIQPVTKAKMKKALQSIAKVERLGSLSTEFVEEMHLSSGGDLRHAIFALQFQSSTMMMTSRSRSRNRNSSEEGGSTAKKDAKLSTFHALGKLLYAKRKPATNQHHHHDFSDDDSMDESAQGYLPSSQSTIWNQSKWNDGRGPLEFVPEDVLSRVDMTLSSAMSFISFHSPDFFMDVTDLSRSFDLISDSATFMDYQFSSSQNSTDGPFPMQYASCIGGRAVADGNRHPAPPQFRQFTAPKVFSVMKKNRENEYKIDKLRKRLSLGSGRSGGGGSGTSQEAGGGITSIHDNIGSAQQFVTDSLPYMRSVIPQDVNYALANLHSYANDASGHANNEPQAPEEKENAVLLEDDLVDDDDW